MNKFTVSSDRDSGKAEHLEVTKRTARSLLGDMEELDLLEETTGRQRNRRYLFRDYFDLFAQG